MRSLSDTMNILKLAFHVKIVIEKFIHCWKLLIILRQLYAEHTINWW